MLDGGKAYGDNFIFMMEDNVKIEIDLNDYNFKNRCTFFFMSSYIFY